MTDFRSFNPYGHYCRFSSSTLEYLSTLWCTVCFRFNAQFKRRFLAKNLRYNGNQFENVDLTLGGSQNGPKSPTALFDYDSSQK